MNLTRQIYFCTLCVCVSEMLNVCRLYLQCCGPQLFTACFRVFRIIALFTENQQPHHTSSHHQHCGTNSQRHRHSAYHIYSTHTHMLLWRKTCPLAKAFIYSNSDNKKVHRMRKW